MSLGDIDACKQPADHVAAEKNRPVGSRSRR
jgi:hypothetical protein